ncbi:hypothetical protein BRADO5001 [Bradyrhizobium sp. ORS 278]|nr:hypothetical protein BRADO5001 [Bradyrhizobium sp. ORS 278]
MPALPPLPQVLADMNGFGAVGARRSELCHGQKSYHEDVSASMTCQVIELPRAAGHPPHQRR